MVIKGTKRNDVEWWNSLEVLEWFLIDKTATTGKQTTFDKSTITHWKFRKNVCLFYSRVVKAYFNSISKLSAIRNTLSWLGHVCRHDKLPKNKLQGTVDGRRRRGRPHKSWMEGQHQGMNRPVDVVIAAHRGWRRPMCSHRSRCICRSTQKTPGCHGIS